MIILVCSIQLLLLSVFVLVYLLNVVILYVRFYFCIILLTCCFLIFFSFQVSSFCLLFEYLDIAIITHDKIWSPFRHRTSYSTDSLEYCIRGMYNIWRLGKFTFIFILSSQLFYNYRHGTDWINVVIDKPTFTNSVHSFFQFSTSTIKNFYDSSAFFL